MKTSILQLAFLIYNNFFTINLNIFFISNNVIKSRKKKKKKRLKYFTIRLL